MGGSGRSKLFDHDRTGTQVALSGTRPQNTTTIKPSYTQSVSHHRAPRFTKSRNVLHFFTSCRDQGRQIYYSWGQFYDLAKRAPNLRYSSSHHQKRASYSTCQTVEMVCSVCVLNGDLSTPHHRLNTSITLLLTASRSFQRYTTTTTSSFRAATYVPSLHPIHTNFLPQKTWRLEAGLHHNNHWPSLVPALASLYPWSNSQEKLNPG